ncbi:MULTISPECIES: nuclear transport factor 2 family protein [Cellulomonas]|uniref:nuclear transport factor 2 family protein n=1 Tax=Cellulomonas TaxID=1707 RepID=UPI00145627BF|nr:MULTISPECIES: nuclear transport factor 2 family protein [Cellulomonas]
MTLADELMASERRLAHGRGAEYAESLTDDALVVVPGAVLDRDACVAAMDASEGWDDVELGDPRLVASGDVATVVYPFRGRRGTWTYRATLASTYRRTDAGWRLALHQQTPEPPA